MRIVILDTNALFTTNEVEVVRPATGAEVQECLKHEKFRLVIPRVVLQELIHQRFQTANAVRVAAERGYRKLEKLSGRFEARSLTEGTLRRAVQRRALEWCKAHHAQIAHIPFATIDWKSMCLSAVWHSPPFSPSNVKGEKGFKDALVAETIRYVYAKQRNTKIVVITKDDLLKSTIEKIIPSTHLSIFEDVQLYLSYLRLKAEKSSKTLVNNIFESAPKRFFSPDSTDCVYYRCHVAEQILAKYPAQFIALPVRPMPSTFDSHGTAGEWRVVSELTAQIGATVFETHDEETSHWKWKTHIVFTQLYQHFVQALGSSSPEYVRVLHFDVLWSAKLTESGEFFDEGVDSLQFCEENTEAADTAMLFLSGLLTRSGRIPTSLPLTSMNSGIPTSSQ